MMKSSKFYSVLVLLKYMSLQIKLRSKLSSTLARSPFRYLLRSLTSVKLMKAGKKYDTQDQGKLV